jgi:hypothetical protein
MEMLLIKISGSIFVMIFMINMTPSQQAKAETLIFNQPERHHENTIKY